MSSTTFASHQELASNPLWFVRKSSNELDNSFRDWRLALEKASPARLSFVGTEHYNVTLPPAMVTKHAIVPRYTVVPGGEIKIHSVSYGETLVTWPEPSVTEKLIAQLEEIQQTSADKRWPGAVWPNSEAFNEAKMFIRSLPDFAPMPNMGLADDGEVNFLWKNDGIHIDLGFYGEGTYSYFARDKNGQKFHGDDSLPSKGLPSEIIKWFKALADGIDTF